MKTATLLLALAALCLPPQALAGRSLIVGLDDDSLKWTTPTRLLVGAYRDLGVDAVRVTLTWEPGRTAPTRDERTQLARVDVAAWATRIVLAVGGPASSPPTTDAAREEFCGYAAETLRRHPAIADVVVWTEPNAAAFWARPDAAAYEALLARCYDVLHALRPGVNVIAASAPHQAPAAWYRALGKALRRSGRTLPILDTVGHNAYPDTSAEPPSARHRNGHLDEGDYGRLVTTLRDAFRGTPQRVRSIWYMEDGFQTAVDASRRPTGVETDVHALDEAAQARQLDAAVRLAYCQPLVGAFFNFELRDETSLAGWQSGVLRADWSQKPAYAALRSAVADVRQGLVRCR